MFPVLAAQQETKLTAIGGAHGDLFGAAAAVEGATAIVGAPEQLMLVPGPICDDIIQGSFANAYIFARSGDVWTQQAAFQAVGIYTQFGKSVALSGDTAVVGAPGLPAFACNPDRTGAVYVYVRSGSTWTTQATFFAGGRFGSSVGLSVDTLVVGASGPGTTSVYTRSGTTWTLQTTLAGGGTGVAIDGTTIAASSGSSTTIYALSSGSWVVQATLPVSGPVSISGNTVVVNGDVWARSGSIWTQQAALGASSAVTIKGDMAVRGASETAYVYGRTGSTWYLRKTLTASDGVAGDEFGSSVATDGADAVFVGAKLDDIGSEANQGSAYVFTVPLIPPATVVTGVATEITVSGATLNGTANPNGSATLAKLEYGLTAGYGSTTPAQALGSGSVSVAIGGGTIAGLACGSLYHFRATATNAGGTMTGADAMFTTSACPSPIVVTGVATAIDVSGATLNGTANPNGLATLANFEYGLTAGYGSTTPAQALGSGNAGVAIGGGTITGLTCNTLYHFRATATNAGGTMTGAEATFTTSACPPATVVTGVALAIGISGATLTGTANPNGSFTQASFDYGPTTAYGSTTPVQALGSGSGAVPFVGGAITSLCATPYHFRAVAVNAGGTTLGSDAAFTTLPCQRGDFNADGLADVLWRNGANGQNIGWLMNGLTVANSAFLPTIADTNWAVVGVGDFDADGKADVILRNKATGQNIGWLMDGLTVATSAFLPTIADTNWAIAGVGDVSGDHKADVILRNKVTGQNIGWLMDGLTVVNSAFLPTIADPNWHIVGIGDLNSDSRADVLWRNQATGQNVGWLMNGLTVSTSGFLPTIADTNWQIVGVGDVNGDGKTDVLLRNRATGQDIGWLMDGLTVTNSAFLPTIADTNWEIKAIGDVNGDGMADVVLRNKVSGQNIGWLMDGLTVTNSAFLPAIADANWLIVGK